MSIIENSWRSRGLTACLLLPISWIYRAVLGVRRWAFTQGWASRTPVPLPVVVVGNLSVGGTGKTPLCAYLVERFAEQGWRPAIVSRGYGGQRHEVPRLVCESDSPSEVGDEPLMLFEQTGVPVCVCVHRAKAVQKIAESTNANIVFSDDGLQHLSMPRVAEILVVDGQRGFGNGWVLPAGPLRDALSSVNNIDVVAIQMPSVGTMNSDHVDGEAVLHHSLADGSLSHLAVRAKEQVFSLEALNAVELSTGNTVALSEFTQHPVHAVAGIGHPQRFFDSLSQLGIRVEGHAMADHTEYSLADISFDDALPVLVTVKDAVKLKKLNNLPDNVWQITTRVRMSGALESAIDALQDKLSSSVGQ